MKLTGVQTPGNGLAYLLVGSEPEIIRLVDTLDRAASVLRVSGQTTGAVRLELLHQELSRHISPTPTPSTEELPGL